MFLTKKAESELSDSTLQVARRSRKFPTPVSEPIGRVASFRLHVSTPIEGFGTFRLRVSILREGLGTSRLYVSTLRGGLATFLLNIFKSPNSELFDYLVSSGLRNPQKLNIFISFHILDWQKFSNFAVAIRKERMTYLLDSLSFTTTRKSNTCYWSCTLRAQISRIHVWFVVNREAYGEGLRLFAF